MGGRVGAGGETTHLADAADVLVPRLLVEPEVLVQPEADVVAVQAVRELVQVEEVLLERARDRRLHASRADRSGFRIASIVRECVCSPCRSR